MICASFSSFPRFPPTPMTNNLGSPSGLCHTINKSFHAREKKVKKEVMSKLQAFYITR